MILTLRLVVMFYFYASLHKHFFVKSSVTFDFTHICIRTTIYHTQSLADLLK